MKVAFGWFEKGFGQDAEKAGGEFALDLTDAPRKGDFVSFEDDKGVVLQGTVAYVAWCVDGSPSGGANVPKGETYVYVSVIDVVPFDDTPA